MKRAALTTNDLRLLPFTTLKMLALAVARDIDAGADDKRPLLETVFEAIRRLK